MTLDEFVNQEHGHLEAFRKYWIAENKKDAEIFPLEIPDDNIGIWHEMLNMFNGE